MTAKSADPKIIQQIRDLLSVPARVRPTEQAKWDMLAHHLTTEDVCDAAIDWIDAGERVKPTTMHTVRGLQGKPAYEMKPKINGVRFYIKVVITQSGALNEKVLLLWVHPDH